MIKHEEWNHKLKQIMSSYENEVIVGFIGALGANDIGDEAMLISNIEKLRRYSNEKFKYYVFTMDKRNTDDYLNIDSKEFTHSLLSNNIIYKACKAFDKYSQKLLFGKNKYIDILSEIFAISWFTINCSLLNRAPFLLSKKMKEHIKDIKKIDILYVIGGAYINSWHVKSRIYPFLFEILLADFFNKHIILSGLNIGPLNRLDRFFVKKILAKKNVKLIGLRDWDESLKELEINDFLNKDKVIYSHDDAFYLEYNNVPNPFRDKKYIVLQAHNWIASDKMKKKIQKIYIQTIKEAIELEYHIIFISMQSYKNNKDYLFSKSIINELNEDLKNYIVIPEELYGPKVLKKIVSEARLLLSTRHHPFLFATSTKVKAIAISYDTYYTQKFLGISNDNSQVFSIEDNIEDIVNHASRELRRLK